MNDVMLENGDIKLDSKGSAVILDDREAKIQRAVICASAQKGKFIYDRSLGSDYVPGMDGAETEAVINEAVSKIEDTYIKVLDCDRDLRVSIESGGENAEREVHFYGEL